MREQTIAAISTPLMAGGVAVIRVSGNDANLIAQKMFKPLGKTAVKDFEPNKMYVGEILAKDFKDFGMCVYFKSPKSFTGEDVIEFHSHGGVAIAKGILKQVLDMGAVIADRGEFTKRAFFNGKLSLSSAEGMIDMINAQTSSQVKAGYYLYREQFTQKIVEFQNKLTDALSEIGADLDYPEEDLEVNSRATSKRILGEIRGEISQLLSTFNQGRIIREGVKIAIVGKPNTGKSSLLNALLDYNKAIVSPVAGTTRDIVEGAIDINGIKFNLYDTAGIRQSQDDIERIGVDLSKKVLKESDLVLFVLDGGDISKEDQEIYSQLDKDNLITVLNKSDLGEFSDQRADIIISAKNKQNLNLLRDMIYAKCIKNDVNGDFICEERHFIALKNANEILEKIDKKVDTIPLDLLSIDIRAVWDCLGEITGETASETIIDNIFKKFCVGK